MEKYTTVIALKGKTRQRKKQCIYIRYDELIVDKERVKPGKFRNKAYMK